VIGACGGFMLSAFGSAGYAEAHGTLVVLLICGAVGVAGMVLGGHFANDLRISPHLAVALGLISAYLWLSTYKPAMAAARF
jgi:predicted MFS family arabinose efflux permease